MDTKSNQHGSEDKQAQVDGSVAVEQSAADNSSALAQPDTEIRSTQESGAGDVSEQPQPSGRLTEEEEAQLAQDIVAALKTVHDPEIPADIYELGLIYKVEIFDDRNVDIDMTLTAPACPVAGEMPIWVEDAVSAVPGVGQVKVTLTFEPPWDMSRMSDEARLALNMF